MADGWMNGRDPTLINFLVASARGLVFLKLIDVSKKIKAGVTLFTLLEEAVLEVRTQNVVQVVTDNAVAFVTSLCSPLH